MTDSTLEQDALDAIVGGYHGAPFDVLGPHLIEDRLVIRALWPGATEIEVVPARGAPIPMSLIHDAGLFEAILPGRKKIIAYKLTARFSSGSEQTIDDPYAFAPTLSDFDAHLMAEGTHLHIYQRLGAHLTELNGVAGVLFAVWAPNAQRVSVVGPFNNWDGRRHPMRFHTTNGVWAQCRCGSTSG